MDAYIYDVVRTPRGSTRKNGSLHEVTAIQLVKQLIEALKQRNPLLDKHMEDLILGCVTQIKSQGANIAKTAATYAGLPYSVAGMTINRFCTSGLDAISIAASKVHSDTQNMIVAGGVESVSNVPMFADQGAWFADQDVSTNTKFIHMGISADIMAALSKISRDQLDAYAVRSHQRAARANTENVTSEFIIPVKLNEEVILAEDELVRATTSTEALAALIPNFESFLTPTQRQLIATEFPEVRELQHLHHVGNSPSLADGAALVIVGNKETSQVLQKQPLARIVGTLSTAAHPMLLLGGQKAAEDLLKKLNLTIHDMDVIEFYEAYAASAVKAMKDWQVDEEKFNPNGGVIAYGHALGATGASMLISLVNELKNRNGKYGLVTLSGGGGVGTAMIIENLTMN